MKISNQLTHETDAKVYTKIYCDCLNESGIFRNMIHTPILTKKEMKKNICEYIKETLKIYRRALRDPCFMSLMGIDIQEAKDYIKNILEEEQEVKLYRLFDPVQKNNSSNCFLSSSFSNSKKVLIKKDKGVGVPL